jgi:hypothetical protein
MGITGKIQMLLAAIKPYGLMTMNNKFPSVWEYWSQGAMRKDKNVIKIARKNGVF